MVILKVDSRSVTFGIGLPNEPVYHLDVSIDGSSQQGVGGLSNKVTIHIVAATHTIKKIQTAVCIFVVGVPTLFVVGVPTSERDLLAIVPLK